MTVLEDLNRCRFLFIDQIYQSGMDLIVVAFEGRTGEAEPLHLVDESSTPFKTAVAVLSEGAKVVEPRLGYGRFTLRFEDILSYAVTDETFSLPEGGDDFTVRLQILPRSAFLAFVSETTQEFAGPQLHFRLLGQNLIVDVACQKVPAVTCRELQEADLNDFSFAASSPPASSTAAR